MNVYDILPIPSHLYSCETGHIKGYNKTKNSRDEIHEIHRRIQFMTTKEMKIS
jgi:hypothetical protein